MGKINKMNGARPVKITIYRGTKEVGGTMIELQTGKTRLLLDAGYPLFYRGEVIDDRWAKKPYQELFDLEVIPKVRGLYRWDEPAFDAVLISHAHSDHFGLLKYVHPGIPIHLSETTDRLIDRNISFPIPGYSRRDRRLFRMYEPFSVGDFTVKPCLMDHSAFQAAAFEIRSEGKTLLYTGDFRGHGRRREYLERFLREAKKEADLLLIEGTTLDRTGEAERTEEELTEEIRQTIMNSRGIVLCQPTAQNIDRVISFYQAAKACGKIFVMDLYTANLMNELKKMGHESLPAPSVLRPDVRVYAPRELTRKMEELLGKKNIRRFPLCGISDRMIGLTQDRIVMLVRPSALPDLERMNLKNGILIYSQWQAYREKSYQVRLEENLRLRGFDDCYLHTSGHAFKEDIKKVITGLSPKKIVPIHTFRPEAFYRFHHNVSLQQDGVPFDL